MKTFLISTLLVISFTSSFAQPYGGRITVQSSSLEEVNDSLKISLSINIKGEGIPGYTAMRLTPKLVSQDNTVCLPDILLIGKKKQRTYKRYLNNMSRRERLIHEIVPISIHVLPESDTVVYYVQTIPYEEWMDNAIFAINQEISSYNDDRTLVVYALDGRVKFESRTPYAVQPKVNYVEPIREQKHRTRQGQAFLDFQVGKSVILPSFRRNPQELENIRYVLSEIQNNKDVKVNGLFIEGYASPDGNYAGNERLSRERAMALKEYIIKNYRLPLSADQIRVASVAEDWEGLRAQVESSDTRYKESILRIIDRQWDVAKRKAQLQQLDGGSVYRMMLQDMYPQLRRVEYQVDFVVRDFTVEETLSMLGNKNELISHYELYCVANTYERNSAEFEHIMLDVAPQIFPNDPVAQINAAATMLTRGETATARRYLEKLSNDPRAWNNLGVVYLKEGDPERAAEYLNKALVGNIEEASFNLRELERKRVDNEKIVRFNNRQ